VVIDSNVIISAAISPEGVPAKIFEYMMEEKVNNYTTYEIISEIAGVLNREKIKSIIDEKYKETILKDFIRCSVIIDPIFNERVIIKDDDDNKFINCALAAKADIISGDRHLLEQRFYKGVKIMSPKEFLENFEANA